MTGQARRRKLPDGVRRLVIAVCAMLLLLNLVRVIVFHSLWAVSGVVLFGALIAVAVIEQRRTRS